MFEGSGLPADGPLFGCQDKPRRRLASAELQALKPGAFNMGFKLHSPTTGMLKVGGQDGLQSLGRSAAAARPKNSSSCAVTAAQ